LTVPGKGTGSDAVIRFTPWRYPEDHLQFLTADQRRFLTSLGIEPATSHSTDGHSHVVAESGFHDITILHEMVHALQMMRGADTNKTFPYQFENVSEFDAILVENIYRSETGRYLRGGHIGRPIMMGTTVVTNATDLKNRLDGFRRRNHELAAQLEGIDTPFNPFKKTP